jgi:hypothetical protein
MRSLGPFPVSTCERTPSGPSPNDEVKDGPAADPAALEQPVDQSSPPDPDQAGNPRWLTPSVASIGTASFFSDSGHEIATALLPSFITSVLHASAGALGIIEVE